MKLRFTHAALAELSDILDFIAQRSPQGAHHVQSRIKTLIELLPDFPHAGQQTTVDQLRPLVATPFPYVVFYRVGTDEIIVVGIRHTSRETEAE